MRPGGPRLQNEFTPPTEKVPLPLSIFSCDCKHDCSKRTILTVGLSGMGKTTTVQSCTLDWCEGKGYEDIYLLFPLPFWELNLLKGKLSFLELLRTFYPELKGLEISNLKKSNVWFVLDGLDECNFPLDFSTPTVSDVSELSTVDGLLTSMIRGNLLPNAHIWITTRPGAATRVPIKHVLNMNELKGFSDEYKELYIQTSIASDTVANKVIDHMKISRSLNFLCQIPQICSILAYVLKSHLEVDGEFNINPITLTEIYTHLVKKKLSAYKTIIAKLEKLALRRWGSSNVIYEKELQESGISVREASTYSRTYPLVLKEERGLYNTVVYRFGHSSIEEFFAASSALDKIESEEAQFHDQTMLFLSCRVLVDQATESETGEYDVFLRFIFGQLKEHGSMKPTNPLVNYTKRKVLENMHSYGSVTLIHCLREFDRHELNGDVELFLKTNEVPFPGFLPTHWNWLARQTEYFEGVQDVFEMDVSKRGDQKLLRQLPDMLKSKKAMLRFSNLTEKCCPGLAAVVITKDSFLRELDLGYNSIGDKGVKILMQGLVDPDCKLKSLRLQGCGLTASGCSSVAAVLRHAPELIELDLSGNEIGELSQCNLDDKACSALASALQSSARHLKVLDLSINQVGDKGAVELFKNVDISKLTKLEMYHCSITSVTCEHICKALQADICLLTELNLSSNNLKDYGFELICKGMYVWSRLEKLDVSRCGITDKSCIYLAKVMCSVSQHFEKEQALLLKTKSSWQATELANLNLSMNGLKDKGVRQLIDGLKNPFGHLKTLNLSHCRLTKDCCKDLSSCFASEDCTLTELDLSGNNLQDKGLRKLCVGLGQARCKMEKLSLRNCGLSSKSVPYLTRALKSNQHLTELLLMGNNLEPAGIKEISVPQFKITGFKGVES
ncbi:NACHT, LRR and PYD domains-containing protein 14-like [Diretmus argenteus]